MDDGPLHDAIVAEAASDWIDLFHAIAVVKIVEGGEGRMHLLERAGPLVVRLVREGRLVAGDLGPRGTLVVWPMSQDHAAEIVEIYVSRALSGRGPFIPWEPCALGPAGDRMLGQA